jgi:hypothetical protein
MMLFGATLFIRLSLYSVCLVLQLFSAVLLLSFWSALHLPITLITANLNHLYRRRHSLLLLNARYFFNYLFTNVLKVETCEAYLIARVI